MHNLISTDENQTSENLNRIKAFLLSEMKVCQKAGWDDYAKQCVVEIERVEKLQEEMGYNKQNLPNKELIPKTKTSDSLMNSELQPMYTISPKVNSNPLSLNWTASTLSSFAAPTSSAIAPSFLGPSFLNTTTSTKIQMESNAQGSGNSGSTGFGKLENVSRENSLIIYNLTFQ